MVRLKNFNILLLEDNVEFAKNTIKLLELYFAKTFHSTTIKDALILFEDNKIDLIISDIKVADGNGLDFITSIREMDTQIPIIVLSAHKNEEFLFKAIPLNILSYELKPLEYKQLLSLLDKISNKLDIKDTIINENLKYRSDSCTIYKDDKAIPLTKKELLLIQLLQKNKGKIVSKDMIQKYIWEDDVMSEAALKNLIFRVRKKVDLEFIETVTNMGYRLPHTH